MDQECWSQLASKCFSWYENTKF